MSSESLSCAYILPALSLSPKPEATRGGEVTLLLAFLAVTITFYFNKFISLCAMCSYETIAPGRIRKKCIGHCQKLPTNALLLFCRSTRPQGKETSENTNISLLFPSFGTVDLTQSYKPDLYRPNDVWFSIWLQYESLASNTLMKATSPPTFFRYITLQLFAVLT